MAIRIIRERGEEILTRPSREVTEVNDKILRLIEDMKDTMYDAGGVGLAAPQVGVLKRIVVIDVTDDEEERQKNRNAIVMINPRIVETSGEQTGDEGCLSVPGMVGTVTRPEYVKAVYMDADMKPREIEGRGLLARAICHETDHLQGQLFVEKVEGGLRRVGEDED